MFPPQCFSACREDLRALYARAALAGMSLDDDEECALCLDAGRELRFRPCGHSLMCELCTLKLIARSANMVAKCPNCMAPIQKVALFRSEPGIAAAWPVGVALPSHVGKDTSQEVSPTRGTYKRSEPTGFSASTDLSVEAFIEEHCTSDNAALKKEADAAKQAWRHRDPRELLPDAALRLPVPNLLAGRVSMWKPAAQKLRPIGPPERPDSLIRPRLGAALNTHTSRPASANWQMFPGWPAITGLVFHIGVSWRRLARWRC